MTRLHPVFYNFQPFSGIVESGFQVDFIGAKSRCEFQAGATALPTTYIQTEYPAIDEEYFEWVDILESVASAKNTYTMLELGAGYGRWSVRAACAVRLYHSMPMRFVAVEAEPVHLRWLETHFRDNCLEPQDYVIVPGVVRDEPGEVLFYVGMPPGGKDRPDEWYGQAITHSYEALQNTSLGAYEGFDLVTHKSGWKSIPVQSVALQGVVADLDRIDLIDLDVQGEELKILSSAIDEVNRKVRRLHIGTHSHEIEKGLRELLRKNGWHCSADFECLSVNQTPMGTVKFVDGVQSWTNPRLFLA